LPGSDVARCSTAKTHEGIEALYARGADALIVTGAEPRAERFADEPFWETFSRLVFWARNHTLGSVWSCLAAHGAVELLDGILRRRQKQKISGVFACSTTPGDWATRDAPAEILVPHSRYNGLCRDDLEQSGYTVSSWSPLIGVDSFWRREPSLFLFRGIPNTLQTHWQMNSGEMFRVSSRESARRFLKCQIITFQSPPRNR